MRAGVHGGSSRFRDSGRRTRRRWVNPITIQRGLEEEGGSLHSPYFTSFINGLRTVA
jgi:hypothetical protein